MNKRICVYLYIYIQPHTRFLTYTHAHIHAYAHTLGNAAFVPRGARAAECAGSGRVRGHILSKVLAIVSFELV